MSDPGHEVVTYRIYARSEEVCERMVRELKRHGFGVEIRQPEAGSWAIEAVLSQTMPEGIDATEDLLSALASESGAVYDGYERAVRSAEMSPHVTRQN